MHGVLREVSEVHFADFDKDGLSDLLTLASSANGRLAVFYQNDTFTFSNPTILRTPNAGFPQSLAIFDANADAMLDVASINSTSRNISLFYQRLPRIFAPGPVLLDLPIAENPGHLLVEHLDGDSVLDFAFSLDNGQQPGLGALLGKPTPLFSSQGTSIGAGALSRNSVAVSNIDSNQFADVAIANLNDSTISVFFQSRPREFVAPALILSDANITTDLAGSVQLEGPNDVAAADLDGDGRSEILASYVFSDNIGIFSLGISQQIEVTVLNHRDVESLRSVDVGHFNDDGRLDIVAGHTGGLTIYFQQADGSFDEQDLASIGTSHADSLLVIDLDGDGRDDIVHSGSTGVGFSCFQEADGSFLCLKHDISGPARSIAAGDLNGDGRLDLAACSEGLNAYEVELVLQTGYRRFSGIQPFLRQEQNIASVDEFDLRDLDGDHRLDLVIADYRNGCLSVFRQRSSREFSFQKLIVDSNIIGQNPCDFKTVDLDGDGELDLVTSSHSDALVFYGGG
jgi:hypothetical protein